LLGARNKGRARGRKIEKQRIGAAKEREWVLPQEPGLRPQALEIPAGVFALESTALFC